MEENREVKREKVRSIPIEQIEDFPDHPFKIQNDEQMQKLIKQFSGPGAGKKMKRMRGPGGFGGFPGF